MPKKWRTLFDEHLPRYDPIAWMQPGEYFDAEQAEFACGFFHDVLRHAKGSRAGQPFDLEPWEEAILGALWGFRLHDGRRRYRECFLYVPKKNGKTAFIAGVLLLVLTTDNELGAELYSAASSRDQAALMFSHASGMVSQSPDLASRLQVYGASGASQQRSILFPANGNSYYRCLAADANTVDGAFPHFVAIDEIHRHKNRDLADILQKGTAAQQHSLVIYTTTADYNRESLCNELLRTAHDVIANGGDPNKAGYDPSFLPVVYEVSPEDQKRKNYWQDPKVWKKANPNLGVTVTYEFMEREVQRCKDNPSKLNSFLRFHLNVVTDAAESWFDMDRWDACPPPATERELRVRPAWAGLDLSSTTDLSGFVMEFPDDDGGYDTIARFWMPADNIDERERNDKVPYRAWVTAGYIKATDGNVIDYDVIREDIKDLGDEFDIQEIAVDPYNATQITTQLAGDGFNVVFFRQGFLSISAPSKELEKLVMSRKHRHGGNPVLRWMASNTVIERDASDNIKPSKRKSTTRIDGIICCVMAIGRAMVRGARTKSVYEERGLTTI